MQFAPYQLKPNVNQGKLWKSTTEDNQRDCIAFLVTSWRIMNVGVQESDLRDIDATAIDLRDVSLIETYRKDIDPEETDREGEDGEEKGRKEEENKDLEQEEDFKDID